jgi:drug/metabolite transporter (DMT)-like permease
MAPALYAMLCLIWGSTWLAIKVGSVGVPPFLGAGLRFLLSTLLVGLVLAARRKRLRLTSDDKICVLSLGLLVFWLDYAAVYWAETRISSGLTAILFSTMPLITSLLSAYWTRSETLTGRKVVGIPVGVLGTALLFWPHERLGLLQALGMLATISASLFAAINLVMMKKHGRHGDPFVLNFFGMGVGAACLLGMSAAMESWSAVVWSRSNVLALFYLSVFGSVIAFSAYYYLIKKMDATVVSLSTLIIPIVALVLGRAFLDERVTPLAIAGIATVLAGVAVAIVPGRSPDRWTAARWSAIAKSQSSRKLPLGHVDQREIREGHGNQKHKIGGRQPREAQKRRDRRRRKRHADTHDDQGGHRQ